MPRWKRVLAAFLSSSSAWRTPRFSSTAPSFGPARPFALPLSAGSIWNEIILMIAVWIAILGAVAWWNVWYYFLWMFLVPAFLAANLPKLAQIHRARRHDRTHTEQRHAQHRLPHLAGPPRRLHPTPRALPWRASRALRVPHAELPNYASSLEPKTPTKSRRFLAIAPPCGICCAASPIHESAGNGADPMNSIVFEARGLEKGFDDGQVQVA